ncbi:MAG: metallophosphoesterase [Nitrososphaerota archaeon]|nr:metallophosphoesterase [Nitrososphaerota archaeon]
MKTRIFFVSDVHGSETCFRKFINGARFYGAKVLVLGGDITGKALVPIVEQQDGRYRLTLHGETVKIKKGELEEYTKAIRNSGTYYFTTTENELLELQNDKARVDALFTESMKSVLRSWINLANERLKGTGVTCYISPGNDDKFEMDELLLDSECVVNPENRVVEIRGGYEMITLGYANPTPWNSPREVSEEKLYEMIENLATQLRAPEKSIFNLHVPPKGTEIDKAPAVDSELKYQREGLGMIKQIYAGSTAVRQAIEKHQPLLGLHGHIHESRGFVRIGRTLCINPGSDYGDGTLRGALVDLEDGQVKEFMLTSG